MRPSPWIIVHELASPGCVAWTGPLLELCRGNGWIDDERRGLCTALRSGGGWTTGGGAAPAYRVMLRDAEERKAA